MDNGGWDAAVADTWITITLQRVSELYDRVAPGCAIDTPEFEHAEVCVNGAFRAHDSAALRTALRAYANMALDYFEKVAA